MLVHSKRAFLGLWMVSRLRLTQILRLCVHTVGHPYGGLPTTSELPQNGVAAANNAAFLCGFDRELMSIWTIKMNIWFSYSSQAQQVFEQLKTRAPSI